MFAAVLSVAVFLLSALLTVSSAFAGTVNIVYVNGIDKTKDEAKEDLRRIKDVLEPSVNHGGAAKRTFSYHLTWNPVGWYGVKDRTSFRQDEMELFLLKVAEENYTVFLRRIAIPHDATGTISVSSALAVKSYLDRMLPGGNSLEAQSQITEADMTGTQVAARGLADKVLAVGNAVVVAHSQGNLLANLAYASLAAVKGDEVNKLVRVVNVANTARVSVHNLELTHSDDLALALLDPLPVVRGWWRSTPDCPSMSVCTMNRTAATLDKPSGYPLADVSHHSFADVYLSEFAVPIRDMQGVPMTAGAVRFRDRFEDTVYAAAASLDATGSSFLPGLGIPMASPPTGSFSVSTSILLSAVNADRIYCSVRSTLDGSAPAEPPEPTETSSDTCAPGSSTVYVNGDSGAFLLVAPASGLKRVKVRFRAWRTGVFGPTTSSYLYQVGSAVGLPGLPIASPSGGRFAETTSVRLTAENAERIYCSWRSTTDGSPPPIPPEPTEAANDACNLTPPNYTSGFNGTFILTAPPSGSKRIRARFRAWNASGFGATSVQSDYTVVAPEVPTQRLIDLSNDPWAFSPLALSGDGAVVVGAVSVGGVSQAAKWTAHGGVQLLLGREGENGSAAYAVSFNGSTIAGNYMHPSSLRAFVWTEGTGMAPLHNGRSEATDVSDDGSVIAGGADGRPTVWSSLSPTQLISDDISGFAMAISANGRVAVGYGPNFVWVPGGAVTPLTVVPDGYMADVSADGSIAVGTSQPTGVGLSRAFRWSTLDGVQSLPLLPGTTSDWNAFPTVISADGLIILGVFELRPFEKRAFVYNKLAGMRDLEDVLRAAGVDLLGWTKLHPRGISADRKVLAGSGQDPMGRVRGWVIALDAPLS